METRRPSPRITLKNLLYLTDFSEPSQSALPFAVSIARHFDCKIHALHIFIPNAYSAPDLAVDTFAVQEECAEREMQRLSAQLADLPRETIIERGFAVWPSIERAIEDRGIDLLVLGTHGRTGVSKLLLGSVAEEIFRRSPIPVLTVGPRVPSATHRGIQFHRIIFATDFAPESAAAAPYALCFAQENRASLIVLHVVLELQKTQKDEDKSVSSVMANLHGLLSQGAELACQPETVIRHGNAAERILELAEERHADLIVLGVRRAGKHLGAAIHMEQATAHNVVARASCPVLTVRG